MQALTRATVRHNYIDHNCLGHNYIGHNCLGHNCLGHNYIGHNYIGDVEGEGFDEGSVCFGIEPSVLVEVVL